MAEQEKPWIGVDLDGTLAHDYGWRGAQHIGSPIKRMVDRVRRWHNAGKRVKIFTARASDKSAIPPIKAWLKKHRLPDLEITCTKDPGMIQLWDDRAVPMRRNRGTRRDDGRIAESLKVGDYAVTTGRGSFDGPNGIMAIANLSLRVVGRRGGNYLVMLKGSNSPLEATPDQLLKCAKSLSAFAESIVDDLLNEAW